MTDFQRCQPAATGSACPEKTFALLFTEQQLDTIRATEQAFHRLTGMTADGPDWCCAYENWQRLAESAAVLLIVKLESLEDRA